MTPVEISFDVDGQRHLLEGIPQTTWDRFQASASRLFPQQGKDAWASLLAEFVIAHAGQGTIMMTDVPEEVHEHLQKQLAGIETDWASLHRYILAAAGDGALELGRSTTGGSGVILMIGVPKETIERFHTRAKMLVAEAMSLLLLGAGEDGTISITFDEAKDANRPPGGSST